MCVGECVVVWSIWCVCVSICVCASVCYMCGASERVCVCV